MIRRTPMVSKAPGIRLDDRGQELTEDIPHFFDLIINDVTGPNRGFHTACTPSHWHREMEAFWLLSGTARMTVDGASFDVKAGDGFFINSEALHSLFYSKSGVEYRSFLFDPGIVAGAPGSVFDSVYVRPLLEEGPAVLRFSQTEEDAAFFEAFGQVFTLCEDEPPAYEFAVREALSRLVLAAWQKGRMPLSRQATVEQEKRVKLVLRWMEAHLREPITLGDISREVNLCPRACQKAFQKYLHCSPMEYLQRRRIFSAAQRLSLTDDPITDIALDCGFSSSSYFSKQFKAQTGSTPKAYRAAVQSAARAAQI